MIELSLLIEQESGDAVLVTLDHTGKLQWLGGDTEKVRELAKRESYPNLRWYRVGRVRCLNQKTTMDELKAAYEALLCDYYHAQSLVIGECSSTIKADDKELQVECDELSREWLGKPFDSKR